ncbi:MAG: glycosyltransferase family 2 protein [Thermoleophilia bacterium]
MPVYNTDPGFLRAAIESVRNQLYPRWELCIADDASTDPRVRQVLREAAASDTRIRVVERDENGHISRASNSALQLATGEFIALLDHDDLLAPEALLVMAAAIRAEPGAEVLYSDEDKVDADGNRRDPFFKTDFDPVQLLGQNFICHLGVYRRSLVEQVGGFRVGYEGSQDYDLALRCTARCGRAAVVHVPYVLYHWRAATGSTALDGAEKGYAPDAGRRAVSDHLAAAGVAAGVTPATVAAYNRVSFTPPATWPRVSVIIPTRDRADVLGPCMQSLLGRTTYPDLELILVDNGSTEPDAVALLARLAKDPRVRVLREQGEFNYSALNNRAAEVATGEFLLLLNNDTEVLTTGWIEELVGWGLQDGVGTVGCMLLYPDGTVQHGGVTFGIGGVAGHVERGLPATDPGYFGRLSVAHEVDCSTGACLLVRHALYRELGGLDERDLPVAFNDVDFGLRVREAGLANVWTPQAVMLHFESKSRGYETTLEKQERFKRETARMQWRWRDGLLTEYHHNPNLSLDTTDIELAMPPRVATVAELLAATAPRRSDTISRRSHQPHEDA